MQIFALGKSNSADAGGPKKARVADPAKIAEIMAEIEALAPKPQVQAVNQPVPQFVKDLLGKNYLGPEIFKKLFGKEVCPVPPLPAGLTRELLESKCEFYRPGFFERLFGRTEKKVKDTHLLVFVPAAVDGEAFTVNKLWDMTKTKGKVFDPRQTWYYKESFANTAYPAGQWVLMPKYLVPGTRDLDYEEQSVVLARGYPKYITAKALGLITGLVLNKLNEGDNGDFNAKYGSCEDKIGAVRVYAGDFGASGLRVSRLGGSDEDGSLGRAAFRNFQ